MCGEFNSGMLFYVRELGRVHSATVKSVDKSTVMVEWHERNMCRGKGVSNVVTEVISTKYTLTYPIG